MDPSKLSEVKSIFGNCRCVSDFEKLYTIGEGTYGTVYCAKDKTNNSIVAIKKVKIHDQNEGFPITSLREIKNLKKLQGHPNIVNLKEVVVGFKNDSIFLVFEYCNLDLGGLVDRMYVENKIFLDNEIKCLILQIMNGVAFIHWNYQIHRDLKLSNLLINEQGIVKIADFGLSREFEEVPPKPYTNRVVTLWYRAPEILLNIKNYDSKADVWSLGCIMAELLNRGHPIFAGKTELNQFEVICDIIGFPKPEEWRDFFENPKKDIMNELMKNQNKNQNRLEKIFPNVSKKCIDLLNKLLIWNPEKRISVEEAMNHPYFYEHPRPSFPEEIKILNKLEEYSKKNLEHLSLKKKQKI